MTDPASNKARLILRNATRKDIAGIVSLSSRTYGEHFCYAPEMVGGQLAQFAEGQFVAEYDGQIVGYCATFRIDESLAMGKHGWREITGGGYASRHDAAGDWLYGMEVCVDPTHRGLRIGRRLYDRRKRLCEQLGLKGIVFGGRLPGLSRRMKQFGSAQGYVDAVLAGKARDLTLSFQLANGFELIGLLPGYLPSDHESLGYAAHLAWRNPRFSDHPVISRQQRSGDLPDKVRVATVQYQQRRIRSFEEFATQVEYFVDIAANYHSDFVVFPELFTLQLLSIENQPLSPAARIRPRWPMATSTTSATSRCATARCTSARRFTRRRTKCTGGRSPAAIRPRRSRPTAGRSA
jgi:GNAT superfamily N-acetyltransferase